MARTTRKKKVSRIFTFISVPEKYDTAVSTLGYDRINCGMNNTKSFRCDTIALIDSDYSNNQIVFLKANNNYSIGYRD